MLTKHLQPCASFSELGLGQRGDATDVLPLILQVHVVDGQRHLSGRRAVDADAVGEGHAGLDLLDGGILVVKSSPFAGPRHLFFGIYQKKRGGRHELDE